MRINITFLFTCLALFVVSHAHAQQWGDLTGRFVYAGEPPKPEPLSITKDVEVFGKLGLVDEALLVDKDGGISDVLVYVRTFGTPVHPDVEKNIPAKVTCDNKGGRFVPHVLPLWVDKQTVLLKNSDPVAHNSALTPLFPNEAVNPLLSPGAMVEYKFNGKQSLPAVVGCGIHGWMRAHIIPLGNPYAAVSGKDGTFKIEKLPAGELEFQVWQEKCGYVRSPKTDGGPPIITVEKDGKSEKPEWKFGRFKLTIKPGANDLGTVKIDPALFQ